MSTSAGPRRRLRYRLMLTFAGFALFVAALFGLYVAVFAYSVEDLLFRAILEREAVEQLEQHARTGRWATPRESWIRVVEDSASLPDGIAAALRDEPRRTEFPGAHRRHYHLHALRATGSGESAWLVAEVSQQLVVRPRRGELLQLLGWSGAVVVLLALLLGWWLAYRTTAPLSKLAALIDDAGPEHLPPAFARGIPNDEVGVLARALEALLARVRRFVEREREFTRDASHELRTPLAVIVGAAERLENESGLSEAGRQSVAHILHSAGQLEQTIATLLTLARETPPARPAAPAAVLPVLERTIVEQAPLIEHKDIDVQIDVPAAASTMLPPTVLHILLSNLIGNAFAHTPGGLVTIDIEAGRLRIANPGCGIHERDFLPFVKREESAGFGLGLSIVQRLCERHGIDLRVEAVAGTTVASIALAGTWPDPVP